MSAYCVYYYVQVLVCSVVKKMSRTLKLRRRRSCVAGYLHRIGVPRGSCPGPPSAAYIQDLIKNSYSSIRVLFLAIAAIMGIRSRERLERRGVCCNAVFRNGITRHNVTKSAWFWALDQLQVQVLFDKKACTSKLLRSIVPLISQGYNRRNVCQLCPIS